jgi:nucleosome binding factor SPN SPT16 subunit
VHATLKKLEYLREAEAASVGGAFKVVLLPREKGDATMPANRAALDSLLGAIASSGGRLGIFSSDAHEGPVAASWDDELSKAAVERVDATPGLEAFFAVKDAAAIDDLKSAGVFTARVLKSVMVREMETVIDEGKPITHAALTESLREIMENKEALVKRKVPVEDDAFEVAIEPVVQSGGEGALGVLTPGSAASSTKPLSHDVRVRAQVGGRRAPVEPSPPYAASISPPLPTPASAPSRSSSCRSE